MYRYWDPPYFFPFLPWSTILLTSYFSSLFGKISWPSPILILPLHVHWFTTILNYDPSLTMTSFLIPVIYNVPLSATFIKFSALSSNKRSLHWNKLKSGNRETIAEFSSNYIVPQKFVKDYVDHLAQIEMCKEKQSAESERQQIQQLEQDTTKLNESNIVFLTKYCHWKFMNLICTWYVRE